MTEAIMATKNYESLDEAMQVSASSDYVRIGIQLSEGNWTQLNLTIDIAKELVSRLQRTIEAAELLSRLDKEGR